MESHLLQMRGLKPLTILILSTTPPVASFTDAWIETCDDFILHHVKQVASFTDAWIETYVCCCINCFAWSHLLQMRGLKLDITNFIKNICQSHLLQMRGLKPPTVPNINIGNVASFTDAWIETSVVIQRLYVFLVASFTDAWIETPPFVQQWRAFESHLLQMRGLKRV